VARGVALGLGVFFGGTAPPSEAPGRWSRPCPLKPPWLLQSLGPSKWRGLQSSIPKQNRPSPHQGHRDVPCGTTEVVPPEGRDSFAPQRAPRRQHFPPSCPFGLFVVPFTILGHHEARTRRTTKPSVGWTSCPPESSRPKRSDNMSNLRKETRRTVHGDLDLHLRAHPFHPCPNVRRLLFGEHGGSTDEPDDTDGRRWGAFARLTPPAATPKSPAPPPP
jgi:hypothetical protein